MEPQLFSKEELIMLKEWEEEYDKLSTVKCKQCGREFPILPMYFNQYGVCLICNQ